VRDFSSLTQHGWLTIIYRTFTANSAPSEEPKLAESAALANDEARQSESVASAQRSNKLADEDDVFRESADDTVQESLKAELGVERPVLGKERRLTLTIPARPKKAESPKKAPKEEEEEDLTDDSAHVSSAVQEDESTPSPTNRPAMGQHSFSLPEVPLMQRGNIYHQHGGRSAAAAMVTQLPGRPMLPQPARRAAPPPPPPAPSPGPAAPSPTASQGAQVPTTSQATRSVSRHPSYASSPVTRSHCKFHKIDVELVDFGPRIIFIVPGCSLVNRDFMRQEEIFDLGDVTPEDTHAMESDIRSLDISGEIISNLLLLVGVEREHEIFYLPQADVPVGRKQRRKQLKLDNTSLGRPRKRDSVAQSARAGASAVKRRRTDDRASATPSVSSLADATPQQRRADTTTSSLSEDEGSAAREGIAVRPPTAASASAGTSTPSTSQKPANPSDARKQRRAPAVEPSVFEDAESYESSSQSEQDDAGDVYQPRSPAQLQSQSRKRRRPTVGEGKSSPHKKAKTE
jgi:hypothetical protein